MSNHFRYYEATGVSIRFLHYWNESACPEKKSIPILDPDYICIPECQRDLPLTIIPLIRATSHDCSPQLGTVVQMSKLWAHSPYPALFGKAQKRPLCEHLLPTYRRMIPTYHLRNTYTEVHTSPQWHKGVFFLESCNFKFQHFTRWPQRGSKQHEMSQLF